MKSDLFVKRKKDFFRLFHFCNYPVNSIEKYTKNSKMEDKIYHSINKSGSMGINKVKIITHKYSKYS